MDEHRRNSGKRRAYLAGTIVGNPVANFAPILGQDVAVATVSVDDMPFRVVGYGDIALQMSEAINGDSVEVDGALTVHTQKTADNQEHERWEIISESWNNTSGR